METSEECWSAEQLRLAEAQIEEQKRTWELKRLAALSGNGEEKNGLNDSVGNPEADGLLTYAHQDAANQVVKRKPGRPRSSKSNLNQSVASSDAATPVSETKRRGRKKAVVKTVSAPSELVTVKKEVDLLESSVDCTPDRPRRRRNHNATLSDASESFVEDCSPVSSQSKALSPRTRSRGSVNINLWTLDVKPLLPGATRGGASPNKNLKDGSSPVPDFVALSNGDVNADSPVPSKKARIASLDLDADPDLDVVD